MGRRQAHFSHEINDAYAEGWDARDSGMSAAINPYKLIIDAADKRKQTRARRKVQKRDIELWLRGWQDRDLELEQEKRGVI